jgi:hypothetical protein
MPSSVAVVTPACRRRAGLAAVEFVMALTVVLFMLVALLWVGRVAEHRAAATVQARHQAWRNRVDARPRSFDFTDIDGGRVTGAAELPVRVSPLLDGLILPRAEVAVIGGSWDHRAERLERSPNRRLYPVLLRTAVAGELADITDVDGLLRALVDGLRGDPESDREADSFLEDADGARQQIDAAKQQRERELQAAKDARRREFETLLGQIDTARKTEQAAATRIDGEIADLQRQATEHAGREPKDEAHRREGERLRKAIEDRRIERGKIDGRLRDLDALETRTRRQAAE